MEKAERKMFDLLQAGQCSEAGNGEIAGVGERLREVQKINADLDQVRLLLCEMKKLAAQAAQANCPDRQVLEAEFERFKKAIDNISIGSMPV